MELLALTSKVLYDNELLEAKKELDKLRKTYETPRVMFETWHEWEETKQKNNEELLTSIKNWEPQLQQRKGGIILCLVVPYHRKFLIMKIEQILEKLSGNSTWSYGKGTNIIEEILDCTDEILTIFNWRPEEGNIEKQQELLHSIICRKLGVQGVESDFGLCGEIPQFMCKRCNSVVDYVDPPAHICDKCEEISEKISNITKDLIINPSRRLLLENSAIIDAPVGEQCAICHEQYLDNENVRKLTICSHSFHSQCIENWFNEQYNCPICREVISD